MIAGGAAMVFLAFWYVYPLVARDDVHAKPFLVAVRCPC
jgi:hypothetical protein